MFEYHGWISIRYHTRDTVPTLQDACWSEVVRIAGAYNFHIKELSRRNGLDTVHFAGQHNHYQHGVLAFFEEVTQVAPGSYGILNMYDSEAKGPGLDPINFYEFVMKRGTIAKQINKSLSPFIPELEDEFDPTRPD